MGRQELTNNEIIVRDVLRQIDFNKINRTMECLVWTWASSNTESGVPSVVELVLFAQDLLFEILHSDLSQLSSGGFTARRDDDGVSLIFSIENGNYTFTDGDSNE